jgi:hypothetical protein
MMMHATTCSIERKMQQKARQQHAGFDLVLFQRTIGSTPSSKMMRCTSCKPENNL